MFECETCKRRFDQKLLLIAHIHHKHGGSKSDDKDTPPKKGLHTPPRTTRQTWNTGASPSMKHETLESTSLCDVDPKLIQSSPALAALQALYSPITRVRPTTGGTPKMSPFSLSGAPSMPSPLLSARSRVKSEAMDESSVLHSMAMSRRAQQAQSQYKGRLLDGPLLSKQRVEADYDTRTSVSGMSQSSEDSRSDTSGDDAAPRRRRKASYHDADSDGEPESDSSESDGADDAVEDGEGEGEGEVEDEGDLRAAATPKAGNGSGSSCHQCKSRRHMGDLVFCCNMFAKRPGKGKRRMCRKKYCWQCLVKFYDEKPPDKRQDPSSTWPCPACRGICCCALCRRVRLLREPEEPVESPPPAPTPQERVPVMPHSLSETSLSLPSDLQTKASAHNLDLATCIALHMVMTNKQDQMGTTFEQAEHLPLTGTIKDETGAAVHVGEAWSKVSQQLSEASGVEGAAEHQEAQPATGELQEATAVAKRKSSEISAANKSNEAGPPTATHAPTTKRRRTGVVSPASIKDSDSECLEEHSIESLPVPLPESSPEVSPRESRAASPAQAPSDNTKTASGRPARRAARAKTVVAHSSGRTRRVSKRVRHSTY